MNLLIRAVSSDEVPLLADMDRVIYSPPDVFSEENFNDPDYTNFLILLNNSPIGSTVLAHHKSVGASYDAPLPSVEKTLYIVSTAFLPEFQSRGFGSIVKAWQIAYARYYGFKTIITNIRASNARSIALNSKFGLRFTGVIHRYYNDPIEDAVVLRLDFK